jgi:hypothetical protein
LREGDVNSKYFHACVKNRGRQNSIKALRVADGWIEGVDAVNHFTAFDGVRPTLNVVLLPSLTAADNEILLLRLLLWKKLKMW